jgi:hypothetical protein
MKKVLYSTTALCAAGMLGATGAAADGIELGLGGYMNTLFSAGGLNNDSDEDYNETGVWNDGEVFFLGSYKHDNGIRFGARVELEVFSGGDNIDERYIFIDGDFGRVVAGSENSAAYIMHYAAPVAGLPINSGWVTPFIPPHPDSSVGFRTPSVSTYLDYGNDESQITYYTPRISGFQLGLSYAPTVNGGGDGQTFPVEADRNTQYHNGFAAGVNFVDDFDGVGIALSAGYTRAEVSDELDSLGADDYQGINLGANLSYAGVTIGGSYANAFDGQASYFYDGNHAPQLRNSEGQSFNVGIAYSTGPWTVGAQYFQGEVEGIVDSGAGPGGTQAAGSGILHAAEEDKFYAATAGLSYDLGPGILARGGVMYGRWDAESGAESSGVIGAAGLSFSF